MALSPAAVALLLQVWTCLLAPLLLPVLGVHPAVHGVWLVPSLLPGPALAAAAVAGMRQVPVSCPWSQAVPSLLAGQPGVLLPAAVLLAALPAAAWLPAAVGA